MKTKNATCALLTAIADAVGPQEARQSHTNVDSMRIFPFDIQGAVRSEFIPQGKIVNKHYYVATLRPMRENVRRNRPENWNSWGSFRRYDNASAYSDSSVREFMAKGKTIIVPYPTFSPDLVPCLLSSPRTQYGVKLTFNNVKMIQGKSREALVEIHAVVFK